MPRTILPTTSNSLETDWNVAGSSGWEAVLRGSDDSTFVSSSTLAEKSTFNCGSGTIPLCGRVMAVSIHFRLRQTVAAAGAVVDVLLVRNDREEARADTIRLTSDQFVEGVIRVREDPTTLTRFTAPGTACLGVGVEIAAAPTVGVVQVTQLWVEVEFVDSPTYYDPYDGALPDALLGDRDWSRVGGETTTLGGWTELNTANRPQLLTFSPMVYDPVRDRSVFFGGGGVLGSEDETWEWDGLNWTQIFPITIPAERQAPLLVYDSKRNRVVMFGGGNASGNRNDTWIYDGNDWTEIFPATPPPIRSNPLGGYDPVRDRIILFAGLGAVTYDDTWEFDGTEWTQVFPATIPTERFGGMGAFDENRGKLVVYGGFDAGFFGLGDTWEYDGVDWTQIFPASSPGVRGVSSVAYDSDKHLIVLFGGVNDLFTINFSDTWTYDGTNWTDITTSDTPTARDAAFISYDSRRREVVIFGGGVLGGTGAFNDTWHHFDDNHLRLSDISPTDAISFFRTEPDMDYLHVTEIESRCQITALPAGPNRFVYAIGRTDNTREVSAVVSLLNSNLSLGLAGSNVDLDDPDNYLASVAVPDLLHRDIHLRLRIDRDDDAQTRGKVQLFVDYAETPLLEAFYFEFPTVATSTVLFGTGGTPPNSENSEVDVDFISWQDLNKRKNVFPNWKDFSLGGNEVVADTIDAAVVKPVFISPPGITAGQSNACCRLDVADETEEASVSQFVAIVATGWRPIETYGAPPVRRNVASAYDSSRDAIVTFGGATDPLPTRLEDTWEYSGSKWSKVDVLSLPTGREQANMAYDANRDKVVMFGGIPEDPLAVALDETWEFGQLPSSITGWNRVLGLDTKPPVRGQSPMVYDANRDRVVLFGGEDAAGTLSDTWEWDGTRWEEITTATVPPPRFGHALIYNSTTKKVLMYGGQTNLGPTTRNDTWEFDGTGWTQLSPAASPSFGGRYNHYFCYDSARDRFVIFGGLDSGGIARAETWEYNGTTWAQVVTATIPVARFFGAGDYDPSRSKFVIYGGLDGVSAPLPETWEYDGVDWTQKFPTTTPISDCCSSLVYDPSRQKVVFFGGLDSSLSIDTDTTWEYNGTDWSQVPITFAPPSGLDVHAMTYDTSRGELLMFGGTRNGGAGAFDDLYVYKTWSLNGRGWRRIIPTSSPNRRIQHAMTYDATRQRVLMFGGFDDFAPTLLGDTQEWDGTDWTDVTPGGGNPSIRRSMRIAYDTNNSKALMVGGIDGGGTLDETWEWDGSIPSWTQLAPATTPTARSDHGLVYVPDETKFLIFGGRSGGGLDVGATEEYDGTDWNAVTPFQQPNARQSMPTVMEYMPGDKRVVLHGGISASVLQNDTWEYNIVLTEPVLYTLGLDYRTSSASALLEVSLQRCSDFFYWNNGGAAWQAASSVVSVPNSATRARLTVMTNITVNPEPDVFKVVVKHANVAPSLTNYIFKVDLRR